MDKTNQTITIWVYCFLKEIYYFQSKRLLQQQGHSTQWNFDSADTRLQPALISFNIVEQLSMICHLYNLRNKEAGGLNLRYHIGCVVLNRLDGIIVIPLYFFFFSFRSFDDILQNWNNILKDRLWSITILLLKSWDAFLPPVISNWVSMIEGAHHMFRSESILEKFISASSAHGSREQSDTQVNTEELFITFKLSETSPLSHWEFRHSKQLQEHMSCLYMDKCAWTCFF